MNKILYKVLIIYSKKELKNQLRAFRMLQTPKSTIYINTNKNSNRKTYLNKSKSSRSVTNTNRTNTITVSNFIHRQEAFNKLQNKSKEKIFKDIEEEYNLICTFNPKIKKNKNIKSYYTQNKQSCYTRLFNDSVQRMNKRDEIEREQIEKMKGKKRIDNKKFYQLYEDYKVRIDNQKKLVTQLDEERGFTFTPDITHEGVGSLYMTKKNNRYLNKGKVSNDDMDSNSKLSYLNNKNRKNFSFIYEYIQNKNE